MMRWLALGVICACSVPHDHFTAGDQPPTTLVVSTTTYDFGTVLVNATTAVAGITVTNGDTMPTGQLAPATLGGPDASAYQLDVDGCAGRVLAPAQSCVVHVKSTPTQPGTPSGTLTISANPGGTVSVALTENAVAMGKLQIQPNMRDFGSVAQSMSSADTNFIVTNTGNAASGTIEAATLSGTDASQFVITNDGCAGQNLAANRTCMIAAKFSPTAPGAKTATLSLASPSAGTGVANLGGKSLAPAMLAVTPTSDDFGMVNVMTATAAHGYMFANTGELPSGALAVALQGTDATQFQLSSDGCSGKTLAAGASCTVNVAFAPTSVGDKAAVVTASATPGDSASVNITGTSIAPADLVFTPTNNNYGNQDVNTTSPEVSFVVQNTGTVPSSTIQASLGGADAGQFKIVSDGCSNQVLTANATCTITASFAPTVYGNHSATLSAMAATGGTAAASLSGNGRDKLTVTVLTSGGNGTGTVSPSSGTLTCSGTTCSGTYYRGTSLTLSQTPDEGMVFRSWAGACTSSPCTVTVDGNLMITAAFDIAFAQLQVTPTSDDFGPVVLGNATLAHAYRFTNTGNIPTGSIAASLAGPGANQFVSSNDTCSGKTLAPGATCSISVAFAPGSTGAKPASLTASATPGNNAMVALTGTGLAPASISFQPNSYSYPAQDVGTTSTAATITLANTGGVATSAITLSLGGANATDFTITNDTCSGSPLAANGQCTVSISFTPAAYGSRTATLLANAATGGGASVSLSGTGRDQVTLTVNLTGNGGGKATIASVSPANGQVGAFTCTTLACSGQFYRGSVVTLAASANTGSLFAGWGTTGACAGDGTGQCQNVTLSANTTATASFVLAVATLGATPTSADLGQVVVMGTGSPVAITYSNSGTIPTGTITVALAGSDTGSFVLQNDQCTGTKLAPGAVCSAQVYFAPTTAGTHSVQLKATASPGGSAIATLTATALVPAALVFTPGSNDYGVQDVGTSSSPFTYTLQNTGTQPTSAIVTSVVGANPSDFTIVSDGCNNQVLGASGSCTISVLFAPTVFGARAASLRATATTGGVATSSLAGTGRDKFTLTKTATGDGTGTIAADTMPIEGSFSCAGTTCTGSYYRGTTVKLTAQPGASSAFLADRDWSSTCTVDQPTGTCTVTLNSNVSVTANFRALYRLTTASNNVGGASGSVSVAIRNTGTSWPTGTSCGTGCTSFVSGTPVTLTANPITFFFSQWTVDCSGTSPQCQLTMNANHTATATFQPANLAFLTSTSQAPPAGATQVWADGVCGQVAAASNLTGTFIAYWGGVSLATRLGNANGWVRRDGKPFAATAADLVAGHSLYPLTVTELGSVVPSTTFVETNGGSSNCTNGQPNWSGIAGGQWKSLGSWSAATFAIFSGLNQPACGAALPLYCLQTDYNVTVTYAKATGRIAFSTSGSIRTGGGIASFDALCTSKAASANLPGTYKALVATSTTTAASRINAMGAPWVRTDGIPVVASPTDLLSATPALIAPLAIDETGLVANSMFNASGATDPTQLGVSTCSDWTDTTSSAAYYGGGNDYPNRSYFLASSISPCSNASFSIYCLQQ